jgi:Raf kinase inhibitor-like YbhB/YbcL family protein
VRRPPTVLLSLLASALVLAAAACDTDDGRSMRPPTSEQRASQTTTTSTSSTTSIPGVPLGGDVTTTAVAPAPFTISVPWDNGAAIDARFTCDGEDVSPLVSWSAPPADTVELALLVTDDDADGFVHWAVAGIPAGAGEAAEAATIPGAIEGTNDFGAVGWGGPCPPAGETHTYRFSLYALDQQTELSDGFTGEDLAAVAGPAALAISEATGTYERAG